MLLQDTLFRVEQFDTSVLRPWMGFILHVVDNGAPSPIHDRLEAALVDVVTRGGASARRRGRTGPMASQQFQRYVRQRLDVPDDEFRSATEREEFLNREALNEYLQALPRPLWTANERGQVSLSVEAPPSLEARPAGRARRIAMTQEDARRQDAEWFNALAEPVETMCLAVIAAWAVDTQAGRLRRCAQCQQFYFAKTSRRDARSFCSEVHRRQYDLAHRDPAKSAAYMRAYRRTPQVRRRQKQKTQKRGTRA